MPIVVHGQLARSEGSQSANFLTWVKHILCQGTRDLSASVSLNQTSLQAFFKVSTRKGVFGGKGT